MLLKNTLRIRQQNVAACPSRNRRRAGGSCNLPTPRAKLGSPTRRPNPQTTAAIHSHRVDGPSGEFVSRHSFKSARRLAASPSRQPQFRPHPNHAVRGLRQAANRITRQPLPRRQQSRLISAENYETVPGANPQRAVGPRDPIQQAPYLRVGKRCRIGVIEQTKPDAIESSQSQLRSHPQVTATRLQENRHRILRQAIFHRPALPPQARHGSRRLKRRPAPRQSDRKNRQPQADARIARNRPRPTQRVHILQLCNSLTLPVLAFRPGRP